MVSFSFIYFSTLFREKHVECLQYLQLFPATSGDMHMLRRLNIFTVEYAPGPKMEPMNSNY